MRGIFKSVAAALALSGALFAGTVNAQAQQGWWGDDGMMPGFMTNGRMMNGYMINRRMMGAPFPGMMGMMGMMNGPVLQGRLAYVKAELGITEAQTTAWNAYSDAMNAQLAAMQGMRDTMIKVMQSGTALERMDAHIQAMETMTGVLKTLKPATEALYKVLTPEQKHKADFLLSAGGMM